MNTDAEGAAMDPNALHHDLREIADAARVATSQAITRASQQDDSWPEGEMARCMRRAHHAALRLSRLVEELERPYGGNGRPLALDLAWWEPATLLSDVLDLFRSRADHRDVRLRAVAHPGAPWVVADRHRIGQLFSRLVEDALTEAAPRETIGVRAEPHGDVVRFSVADGSGRKGPEREEDTLVRRIVDAHGGSLGHGRHEDDRSAVVFTLPVAVPGTLREGREADW